MTAFYRRYPFFVLILLLLNSSAGLYAQSCTGVAGKPIVNQTFGSGKVGALPATQTAYSYVDMACPDDGQYTITSTISDECFGNYWYKLPEDHTPNDTEGNMLLVNTSNVLGNFYNQVIDNVCAGSTFEFSAWVINVVNPRNLASCIDTPVRIPSITMQIETVTGTVLQKINTGLIGMENKPTWNRYATLFTVPAGVSSIRLRLINNEVGGCGNDVAIDDILFSVCSAPVRLKFTTTDLTEYTVCQGTRVNAVASLPANGYDNPGFQWQVSDDGVIWQNSNGVTGRLNPLDTRVSSRRYYRVLGGEAGNLPNENCTVPSNTLLLTVIDPQLSAAPVATKRQCNAFLLRANASTPFVRWQGDGITAAQAAQDTLTVSGTGKKTYVLRVYFSKNDTICFIDRSIEVSFPDVPTYQLGLLPAACQDSVVLDAPVSTDFDRYSWVSPDGSTASGRQLMAKTDGRYTVIVTNSGTGCVRSESVTVRLNRLRGISLTESVCLNASSITLTTGTTDTAMTTIWTATEATTPTVVVSQAGTYQVRITTPEGCSATRVITVLPGPQVWLGPPKTGCEGDRINLAAVVGGSGPFSYAWSTGETTPLITPTKSGVYSLTVTQQACSNWDSVTLTVNPRPITAGDETVCIDKPLVAGAAAGNLSYFWLHSGERTREIRVNEEGTYTVQVTNQFGCSATKIITASGFCYAHILAPTAFTPNDDGANDRFAVTAEGVDVVRFTIYNRWGEVIFVGTNADLRWDGTFRNEPCPGGTYTYTVTYKTNINNSLSEHRGVVLLIR